jgi:hypothetical protein
MVSPFEMVLKTDDRDIKLTLHLYRPSSAGEPSLKDGMRKSYTTVGKSSPLRKDVKSLTDPVASEQC